MNPVNSEKLIALRAKKLKPAEMILVSLIGRLGEQNHTVYANPLRDYDWGFLSGLKACIYASSGIEWQRTAKAIAKVRPEYLALWDAGRNEGAQIWLFPHGEDVDKPRSQWRWFLDHLDWMPVENWEFSCD